jgi:hypothetical protein
MTKTQVALVRLSAPRSERHEGGLLECMTYRQANPSDKSVVLLEDVVMVTVSC